MAENSDEASSNRERLQPLHAGFHQFVENSHNAFLIADPNSGAFEYLSISALRVWGGGASLSHARQWTDSIHPQDQTRVTEGRARVEHGAVAHFEYRIVADGVVVRHLRETSFPISHPSGAGIIIGSIIEEVLLQDIPVYVVSRLADDARRALDHMAAGGRRVKFIESAHEFLSIADVLAAGCVLIDLRTALDLSASLADIIDQRPTLVTILIGSPQASAAVAVEAMKRGAVDYLIPPLAEDVLIDAITSACALVRPDSRPELKSQRKDETPDRLAHLPSREREVLRGLLDGGTNKTIARELGLSPRTIELHRARLMERLGAHNLADLFQRAFEQPAALGLRPGQAPQMSS